MANTATEKDIKALKDDIAALRKDLEKLTATAGVVAGDAGRAAAEGLRQAAEATRAQVGQATGAVEKQIEARPWTSVAMAFGAGFLFGKLLDRR